MCRDGFKGECPQCGKEVTCRDETGAGLGGCYECVGW